VIRLRVGGLASSFTDLSVTHDEGRRPRVTLDAQIPVTNWNAVGHDPRPDTRVTIEIDGRLWCDLLLDEAEVARSNNGAYVHLLAQSDERVVSDRGTGRDRIEFWPADEASDSIVRLIRKAQPDARIVNGTARASFVSPEDPFIVLPGDDSMDAIDDISDRTGIVVFNDGLEWRISQQPELAGTPHLVIRDGDRGNLLDYNAKNARADFYNAVLVRHTWKEEGADGREMVVEGYVEVGSGPLSVSDIGVKVLRVDRNFAASVDTAVASARSILTRSSSRGRAVNVTAVADFSLRPGDTVLTRSAQTTDLALVASVAFDLVQHRMQVITRTPIEGA
jgi:hypothetical protein